MTSTATSTEARVRAVIEEMQKAGASVQTGLSSPDQPAPRRAAEKLKAKGQQILEAGAEYFTRPNGQKYYTRKIGIHDDVAIMWDARTRDIPVLLYGEPGNGKTSLFEAAYTESGFRYLGGSGDTEVADFIGSWIPMPGGTFRWVDGPLIEAVELGLPFLCDDISLIDSKVLSVVYSLTDGRNEIQVTQNPDRGTVRRREGFVFHGACNPNAPGSRMSEALLSRFRIHVEVGPDFKLAGKLGVDNKMVMSAENMYTKVRSQDGGLSWSPGLRELFGFKQIFDVYGEDMALANVVAQAPEIDREVVADLLSANFGKKVAPLVMK